jgi:hypothetical protein
LAFPKTKLPFKNESVIVTKAHVLTGEQIDKEYIVEFKDASYLVIDELIAPSGKRMSGQAFKNGYAAGA